MKKNQLETLFYSTVGVIAVFACLSAGRHPGGILGCVEGLTRGGVGVAAHAFLPEPGRSPPFRLTA